MKLLNAGLGRTGTTSLRAALETLGYAPVFHTNSLFDSLEDTALLTAALAGRRIDWHTFLTPYRSADWPAAFFYKDILRAHPEAKVMVSVRDPGGWFESLTEALEQMRKLELPSPRMKQAREFLELGLDTFFEGRLADKSYMVHAFGRHTAAVKASVGPNNVLVYDVREGWGPLCAFLEVEVPLQAFPHLNQREIFTERVTKLFSDSEQP